MHRVCVAVVRACVCKSGRDNITAVSGARVWVNYHPVLSTSTSLHCLSAGLVVFPSTASLVSPPLPSCSCVTFSFHPLSLPTLCHHEVGYLPTKSASLENFPPHLCVCVRECVCPSLLHSSFPPSSPSLSLSRPSISTLGYISLDKSAIFVKAFMSERDGHRGAKEKLERQM